MNLREKMNENERKRFLHFTRLSVFEVLRGLLKHINDLAKILLSIVAH